MIMHIRCGSLIVKKGVLMKKEGSRLFFGQFFTIFPAFLFYTFKKKVDSIPWNLLHPLLWWLNQTYDAGYRQIKRGGGNILKERTRSNNNVFTYYIVCSFSNIFNQRENFYPWHWSPNMDVYMSTKNLTMNC